MIPGIDFDRTTDASILHAIKILLVAFFAVVNHCFSPLDAAKADIHSV
jgi:hypothetical protein